MRKKIVLFIFSLIISFCCLDNLYARETKVCKYKLASANTTITFDIIDGHVESNAKIAVGDSSRGIDITNGQKALEGSSFVGDTYYKNNKDCPPYVFLSDSGTGNYVHLTDESNASSVEKAIKNKYSTLKSGYPKKFPRIGSDEQIEEEQEFENTISSSCMSFTTEQDCRRGYTSGNKDAEIKFSCIWNENEFGKYCNVDKLVYVKCGDTFDIPYEAPKIISFVVYLLKIGTPIILIFFSMVPLVKALASSKEDEIKKAQKVLVKKLIAAALVFFVVSIVQFVIMKVADSSETDNISKCFDCFLNDNCEDSTYYKTNVGGTYLCKPFSGSTYVCEGNK